MIIQEVHVTNFRSILDESLPCDSLTALVGRNGSGKSSFLRALDLFYNPSAKIMAEDFYAADTTQDIEIAVTFASLNIEEKELFTAYIDNGTLTIARIFSETQGNTSGTYYGVACKILTLFVSEMPVVRWISEENITRSKRERTRHCHPSVRQIRY